MFHYKKCIKNWFVSIFENATGLVEIRSFNTLSIFGLKKKYIEWNRTQNEICVKINIITMISVLPVPLFEHMPSLLFFSGSFIQPLDSLLYVNSFSLPERTYQTSAYNRCKISLRGSPLSAIIIFLIKFPGEPFCFMKKQPSKRKEQTTAFTFLQPVLLRCSAIKEQSRRKKHLPFRLREHGYSSPFPPETIAQHMSIYDQTGVPATLACPFDTQIASIASFFSLLVLHRKTTS